MCVYRQPFKGLPKEKTEKVEYIEEFIRNNVFPASEAYKTITWRNESTVTTVSKVMERIRIAQA